jgi:hypothetical protein
VPVDARGFAEAYTIAGGDDPAAVHCGTFRRVLARCTSGDYCPGGRYAFGNTDPTLCNGAPAYQKGDGDGPVLLRIQNSGGITYWDVADSSALDTCFYKSLYLWSAYNDQLGGGPPSAPAYTTGANGNGGTGYSTRDQVSRLGTGDCYSDCGITVTAGGRGLTPSAAGGAGGTPWGR